jgi:hypothetical protein
MTIVTHAPYRFTVLSENPTFGVFFFNVIFRDVEGVVQILAVAHKRRRPDYWLSRL